jgi:branched-chain amino acid transport system substrate-binding protein
VHEEYLPANTTDFTAGAQRLIDKLKDQPGRKIIWVVWAGAGNPFKIADMDLKRYGIEIATGGNILPAMASLQELPGHGRRHLLLLRHPQEPRERSPGGRALQAVQGAARLLHRRRLQRGHGAGHRTQGHNGDVNTNKLIKTMEGMSFDTPKGKMTFRKEDHQAMQSMYHFKIKNDPAFAWGVPELVREIKPEEMNVPIRNKR